MDAAMSGRSPGASSGPPSPPTPVEAGRKAESGTRLLPRGTAVVGEEAREHTSNSRNRLVLRSRALRRDQADCTSPWHSRSSSLTTPRSANRWLR